GREGRARGRIRSGTGLSAACSSPSMEALPGGRSEPDSRRQRKVLVESVLPSRRVIRGGCMQPSTRQLSVVSTAQTTPVKPGDDHGKWREDMELLVQPADRTVLSRDHR